MIKFLPNLEEYLAQFHAYFNTTTGVDLDKTQALVYKSIPKFTLENAVTVTLISTAFWTLVFFLLHYTLVHPVMYFFRG